MFHTSMQWAEIKKLSIGNFGESEEMKTPHFFSVRRQKIVLETWELRDPVDGESKNISLIHYLYTPHQISFTQKIKNTVVCVFHSNFKGFFFCFFLGLIMEGSSFDSNSNQSSPSASAANDFLSNLPSRGLFSSSLISSNPVTLLSLMPFTIFLCFCFVLRLKFPVFLIFTSESHWYYYVNNWMWFGILILALPFCHTYLESDAFRMMHLVKWKTLQFKVSNFWTWGAFNLCHLEKYCVFSEQKIKIRRNFHKIL